MGANPPVLVAYYAAHFLEVSEVLFEVCIVRIYCRLVFVIPRTLVYSLEQVLSVRLGVVCYKNCVFHQRRQYTLYTLKFNALGLQVIIAQIVYSLG